MTCIKVVGKADMWPAEEGCLLPHVCTSMTYIKVVGKADMWTVEEGCLTLFKGESTSLIIHPFNEVKSI